MGQLFSRIACSLSQLLAAQDQGERERFIDEAVERVVDGLDPRLRAIGNYARRLRPALEHMLAYAEVACARLPGPIECSRAGWASDPLVHAVFATAADLQRTFSENRLIQDFFRSNPAPGVTHAYAVMGMAKREKTVLGIDRDGELMRRDVPQTFVSFCDHRITHPAPDEASLRRNLKDRALNEFIAQALERVARIKEQRKDVREQRAMLEIRLKMLEKEAAGLTGLLDGEDRLQAQIQEVQAQLEQLHEVSADAKQSTGTLDTFLDHAVGLLSRPEELIQVNTLTLRLDLMNRLHDDDGPGEGRTINLAQVYFGERFARVAILARFPRDELVPPQDTVSAAARLLM